MTSLAQVYACMPTIGKLHPWVYHLAIELGDLLCKAARIAPCMIDVFVLIRAPSNSLHLVRLLNSTLINLPCHS